MRLNKINYYYRLHSRFYSTIGRFYSTIGTFCYPYALRNYFHDAKPPVLACAS